MFSELVQAFKRFRAEDKLPPAAYKPKDIKWVVELGGQEPRLSGPFKRGEFRTVHAPDRQRSGKPGGHNLKPFLLVDKAQYALGKAPTGKETETRAVHQAFLALLETAAAETHDDEIRSIRECAGAPPHSFLERVQPEDLIAFRVDPVVFPCERQTVRSFWAEHLARELQGDSLMACGVCGVDGPVLRILPRELILFGQKCQVVSVNTKEQPAFGSFGREQLENSPLCFGCASAVVDSLDYLIRDPLHSAPIVIHRDAAKRIDPFRSQLAVFWLSHPVVATEAGGQAIDLEQALRILLTDRSAGPSAPRPDVSQLDALLRAPWTGRDASFNLDTESFNLAVLSANKARLVVREWLCVSVADLRARVRRFLEATRLVGFRGEEPRPRPIGAILDALPGNSTLSRGLLRTAYLGQEPPSYLLPASVARLRTLWQAGRRERPDEEAERIRHIEALTTAIKLVFDWNQEDTMEQQNTARKTPAYLCGALLAILERAQQLSHWVRSHQELDRTIVDRYYGSASTAPCSVFGNLIRLATTAHLPDAGALNAEVESVMRDLGRAGGFPSTLTAAGQADFALGFYCQRAAFRLARQSHQLEHPADPAVSEEE